MNILSNIDILDCNFIDNIDFELINIDMSDYAKLEGVKFIKNVLHGDKFGNKTIGNNMLVYTFIIKQFLNFDNIQIKENQVI